MRNTDRFPKDVQQVLRTKWRKRVWPSIGWYGVWLFSICRYYAVNPDVRPHWSLLLFSIALLLLPLWIFRLHEVLFDGQWEGDIVRIKYRKMSEIPFLSEDVGRVERNETAILYVRRVDGKVRRFACRRLWRAADRCYQVGDTVRHIPLVPLPKNLTREPDEGRLCLLCATLSTDSHRHCAVCDHTLF